MALDSNGGRNGEADILAVSVEKGSSELTDEDDDELGARDTRGEKAAEELKIVGSARIDGTSADVVAAAIGAGAAWQQRHEASEPKIERHCNGCAAASWSRE